MEILFTSLHQIDHSSDTIIEIDISTKSDDLLNYVQRLFDEITRNPNKRKFRFESDTTEVRTSISHLLQMQHKKASKINAERLLKIEKQTQDDISHFDKEIQKGSLFQAFIKNENSKRIIISKADHNAYIDELDFKTHKGLPWKKKIFKAFIAEIDNSNQIDKVFVYDTNPKMSKYWWRAFLELTEIYTDTHNTKRALDILDKKIFNPIRKEYPADHTILRNSSVRYFRSQPDFELSSFISDTFENYTPVNTDFPTDKIIKKVELLPDKWDFDTKFTIRKEEIDKRVVNKIPLTEKIDLVIKDYIENLGGVISSDKDTDGKKFVKIYSDIGFERFKRSESTK